MSTMSRRQKERSTPYSCSTRRKRRAISPDFVPYHDPTTDELKVVTGILHKMWTLFWVSPLWKFNPSHLTMYSETLSQFMESHDKRNLTVRLSILERFGRDGSDGVGITLSQNEGSELATALLCVMSQSIRLKKGFTSLPLLLLQGNAVLSQLISEWLQTAFDCHISPYSLEQDDLSLLLAQYATARREGPGESHVELVYDTPENVGRAGLSSLTMTLPKESVSTLWDSVNQVDGIGSAERKTSHQRELFLKALTGHLVQLFHLKVENFTLSTVTTPVLHADKLGHIKFQSSLLVVPVLSMLQERREMH